MHPLHPHACALDGQQSLAVIQIYINSTNGISGKITSAEMNHEERELSNTLYDQIHSGAPLSAEMTAEDDRDPWAVHH